MCFAKTCRVAWLPLANASGGPPECPRLHAGATQRGAAEYHARLCGPVEAPASVIMIGSADHPGCEHAYEERGEETAAVVSSPRFRCDDVVDSEYSSTVSGCGDEGIRFQEGYERLPRAAGWEKCALTTREK